MGFVIGATISEIKEQYQAVYEDYIAKNKGKYLAENFPAKNGVISVGIHKPDFGEKLNITGEKYE